MDQVGALLADARGNRMVTELGQHTGLGDRVVRAEREHRPYAALDGIDAVTRDQQQPVRGAALAVLGVGVLSNDPGQPSRWRGRAEDRSEELVLERPLARPLLGLSLR